jgi:hypothetical protein
VPQGLLLGPLLWNLVYDGLLRLLDPVKDVDAVAFAGDLALVITMRKSQDIVDRIREAMKLVTDWYKDAGLHLAPEMTEVVLLTGKCVSKVLKFDVGNGEITTRNTVRYLGILIDNARRYSPHLDQVCDKTERFVGATGSLLPNVNGHTDTVRKLCYGVYESVILYVAQIWASALNMERNKKILRSAQRAYRTVSYAALYVVTGSMTIHIKAKLR